MVEQTMQRAVNIHCFALQMGARVAMMCINFRITTINAFFYNASSWKPHTHQFTAVSYNGIANGLVAHILWVTIELSLLLHP